MTPAERLRAAADTIERTANATDLDRDDWQVETALLIEDDEVRAHVNLWDPPTALLVAPMLQFEAHVAETAGMAYTDSYALELADHILTGGAS
jgi:hypothetical protein